MKIARIGVAAIVVITGLFSLSTMSFGHGDVQPQFIDTTGLKPLGEEWLTELPYTKEKTPDLMKRAIDIGCLAYTMNCARCHGIGVISGGTSPDLRYLEKDADGDEWFLNRVRKGYHQNGITKMPRFEGILPQEAMWSIRAYINIRPEDDDEALKPGVGASCPDIDYKKVLK